MRAVTSITAKSECPPSAKKSSVTPIGFRSSNSSQIATSCSSSSVRAATTSLAATRAVGLGNAWRSILPFAGKQLMLYLSALPASGAQTFKYRLQATMPVTASDGGAEVYLYYQPKQRSAAKAVTLQVVESPATI